MGLKTSDGAVGPLSPVFGIDSVLRLSYYSSDSTGEEDWIAVPLQLELTYCQIASITTFFYLALQLFKGVCDISHGAVLIPDRISDYLSFILDQAIQGRDNAPVLRRVAIVSFTLSFAAFLIMAACALLSGYKLCKRIIW